MHAHSNLQLHKQLILHPLKTLEIRRVGVRHQKLHTILTNQRKHVRKEPQHILLDAALLLMSH